MKKYMKHIASIFTVAAILAISAAAVSANTVYHRGEHIDYNHFVAVETGNGSAD